MTLYKLGLSLLALGAAAPVAAEPFRFPWDPPERPAAKAPAKVPARESTREPAREPARASLSPTQVRSILANEGAQMIGTPHRHGGETIVLGRDINGDRQKFTLDAEGQVVNVETLATRESQPAHDDLRSLDRPLPAPQHSIDGPDELPQLTPAEPKAATKTAPLAAPASEPAKPPVAADSALSPIKPLHPPGAPKIEPLPQ